MSPPEKFKDGKHKIIGINGNKKSYKRGSIIKINILYHFFATKAVICSQLLIHAVDIIMRLEDSR